MKRSRFLAVCMAACAAGTLQLAAMAQTSSQPGVPAEQPPKFASDPLDMAAVMRENKYRLTKAIETAQDETKGIAISAKTRMLLGSELRTTLPTRDTRPEAARDDQQRIPAAIVCCVDMDDQIKFVTVNLASGEVVNIREVSPGELEEGYAYRHDARGGSVMDGQSVILRGDELIGRNVVNHQGEKLGEIHDLAIDPESGRIAYAVLSRGGVLGVGDKLYAIPWKALSRHSSKEGCLLDVDAERLESAPGFDKDNWPNMADARWAADVNTFFKTDAGDFKPRRIVKASDVMGRDVHNTQNEDIGDIKNLAIDGRQGRVQYAVLSFGGVLGMGDKLFAIPWDALRLNTEGDKYIIAIDKDRLRTAPGFDKNQWPDMASEQWGRQIREFYGTAR